LPSENPPADFHFGAEKLMANNIIFVVAVARNRALHFPGAFPALGYLRELIAVALMTRPRSISKISRYLHFVRHFKDSFDHHRPTIHQYAHNNTHTQNERERATCTQDKSVGPEPTAELVLIIKTSHYRHTSTTDFRAPPDLSTFTLAFN
jgi:hypothetical protein